MALPYHRGTVTNIVEQNALPSDDQVFYTQVIEVKLEGKDTSVRIAVGSEFQPLNASQLLAPGAQIIVTQQSVDEGQTEYVVADVFRLPILAWLGMGFFLLVIVVARWQGLLSIIGMAISLAILSLFIVPQILSGVNPTLVSVIGAGAIATITIYLSHGFNWHSHLALVSMLSTLLSVAILSAVAVRFGQFAGLGSEEAYFLQFGDTAKINLQGLLLGGILLGTLGILDDICIAQISTVFQLKAVNSKLRFEELYARGLSVGKDHVASLVNTLVLAYAGANLPLFILFTINKDIPFWVTLNNEIIAEEVVRTLVGSIGLVLAVPIATGLAAYAAEKLELKKLMGARSGHQHDHSH
ncbi:MAG TPA: YibE/F family protein [Vitreimonas sp.]|nr:YibE/F family protein [Vitreimonas sp.]